MQGNETRRRKAGRALALMASLVLSACGGAAIVPPPATGFTPAARPPALGNNAVIGADARALTRQFGEPRLDIRDPSARKLQFSNAQCVLDAYLYPPRARREPVVTYAEARTAAGDKMDWADCASALRRR